jgi:hypothetical protein
VSFEGGGGAINMEGKRAINRTKHGQNIENAHNQFVFFKKARSTKQPHTYIENQLINLNTAVI